jgi:hypothetical protein
MWWLSSTTSDQLIFSHEQTFLRFIVDKTHAQVHSWLHISRYWYANMSCKDGHNDPVSLISQYSRKKRTCWQLTNHSTMIDREMFDLSCTSSTLNTLLFSSFLIHSDSIVIMSDFSNDDHYWCAKLIDDYNYLTRQAIPWHYFR